MVDIVDRLRAGVVRDNGPNKEVDVWNTYMLMQEAAQMLEFFFEQMQTHSVHMDGQHTYRFRSSGWPMNYCVGPNRETAVTNAILEVTRKQREEKQRQC